MSTFLQEHGEALLYGIIGVFILFIVCTICTGKWKDLVPGYKNNVNKSNKEFRENIEGQYPQIIADEIIYATYKDEEFDYRDFIKAKDCNGLDITNKIKYYGNVNVFKRGIYSLKCVVKSANELVSSKSINVIVE